ncbi:MAG: HD domain-containing phosphohydrolase [Armatimonadota bacterium]
MHEKTLRDARILIIDTDEANVRLLRAILKQGGAGSSPKSTGNPREVSSCYIEFQPDLIVLNLGVPNHNGLTVLDELKPLIPEDTYLPILAIVDDAAPEVKEQAVAAGATDFLRPPFDATEVLARMRNLLETRHLHTALQTQDSVVQAKIRERARENDEAQVQILQRMAVMAEYRDDLEGMHTHRVGEISALLAWALGLPEAEAELIRRAAPLHDVGKIAIPERILLKPTGLTREEFEEMKTHTITGARILSGSRIPILQMAEQIALSHHENWDGTGYPLRLRGKSIPLVGRIVALADAYDAFTHDRPYRKALDPKEAWEILWEGAGSQWDEEVLEAFASTGMGRRIERERIVVEPAIARRPPALHLRR